MSTWTWHLLLYVHRLCTHFFQQDKLRWYLFCVLNEITPKHETPWKNFFISSYYGRCQVTITLVMEIGFCYSQIICWKPTSWPSEFDVLKLYSDTDLVFRCPFSVTLAFCIVIVFVDVSDWHVSSVTRLILGTNISVWVTELALVSRVAHFTNVQRRLAVVHDNNDSWFGWLNFNNGLRTK